MSFLVGIRPVTFCCTSWRSASPPASRLRMISAKPNSPIATVAKPRPSASSGMLKAIRDAPVSMSDPTIDSSRPNTIIAIAFSTDPLASTTAKIRPSTISEKYSAGPNASASLVRGRAEHGDQHGGDAAGEERADRGDRQRRTGAALLGHLEAVERGHHRARLARNVDQDRGGRAAILRAVIDAGEHDQRADRRQAEGDRQQHGDRGNGADARQHADQRADQRTDQAQQDVDGNRESTCRRERRGSTAPTGIRRRSQDRDLKKRHPSRPHRIINLGFICNGRPSA